MKRTDLTNAAAALGRKGGRKKSEAKGRFGPREREAWRPAEKGETGATTMSLLGYALTIACCIALSALAVLISAAFLDGSRCIKAATRLAVVSCMTAVSFGIGAYLLAWWSQQ